MTSHGQDQHVDVGAYVLGVLDDSDAVVFEEHLNSCARCSQEFDSLVGLGSILSEFSASAPTAETLTARPSQGMLDRLVDEVAVKRRTQRQRRLYLVAAAAALIVGGPLAVGTLSASDVHGGSAELAEFHKSPAKFFFDTMKENGTSGTDPQTKVQATVKTEPKDWGTHVVMQIGNVRGPFKCDLIAVSKNGEKQTVTTWTVGKWGYGIKKPTDPRDNKQPLYMHGGAAMSPQDIDHFEVNTLDGKHLVSVKA
ncbi:zf-HC2 domain-containing protein [Wenjunlia tyrosinilytica]|jgi:hypothetical protein|uniref:RNA polymerase subunit sigma n=1 Tax=Wenjunlia tyrosinilytica TaxID=1544741 RepID=A0A917ZQR1_9ACTN|nr:zf-HC2 domain-containing protein [Wenjunlia tyrosinilytica]GGO88929.1 RNA polymerase subunit sigma [Wenjunlia tyrosinilytica]